MGMLLVAVAQTKRTLNVKNVLEKLVDDEAQYKIEK